MRTINDLEQNTQVQITENIKTVSGDVHGVMGFLNLRDCKKTMSFMATIDDDNGKKWEHVSVSYYDDLKKTPTWAEMCAVKDVFWNAEEEVHQIHPKESQYVHGVGHAANQKTNILHLWRPVGGWKEEELS